MPERGTPYAYTTGIGPALTLRNDYDCVEGPGSSCTLSG